MSRPVPSPSMKGTIGRSGTSSFWPLIVIFAPPAGGTGFALLGMVMGLYAIREGLKKGRNAITGARPRTGMPPAALARDGAGAAHSSLHGGHTHRPAGQAPGTRQRGRQAQGVLGRPDPRLEGGGGARRN